ncbi:hypothetical protein K438DRAFT_1158915 [Mycena galopus ATCC 62051]|nr:hypothetical protein K438DRAFT_1158915 [Mycena galopus ATCC 62051]
MVLVSLLLYIDYMYCMYSSTQSLFVGGGGGISATALPLPNPGPSSRGRKATSSTSGSAHNSARRTRRCWVAGSARASLARRAQVHRKPLWAAQPTRRRSELGGRCARGDARGRGQREREEEESAGVRQVLEKQADNTKLQIALMQLRNVCPQPFLFACKPESRMCGRATSHPPPRCSLHARRSRSARAGRCCSSTARWASSRAATADVPADLPIDILPTSALGAVHEAELLGASSRRSSNACGPRGGVDLGADGRARRRATFRFAVFEPPLDAGRERRAGGDDGRGGGEVGGEE